MKKIDIKTRRILRRALALVLAVVLVSGLGLSYSSDRVLKAEELTAAELQAEKTTEEKAEEKAESKAKEAAAEETRAKEEPGTKEEPAAKEEAPKEEAASESVSVQEEGSASGADEKPNASEQETAVSEDEIVLDAPEGAAAGENGGTAGPGTQSEEADAAEQNAGSEDADKTDEDIDDIDNEENGDEDEEKEKEEFWIVTFYNRDAEVYRKVEVAKGEAIGDSIPEAIAKEDNYAYWAVGDIVQGGQGREIRVTGDRINSSFTPSSDTIIVPDYDKITYTVTFYDSEGGPVIDGGVRTVGPDTNYCLNDIPSVPSKQGSRGRWVYAGGRFSNTVTISEDTAVWAEYDQNVFTVTFTANGEVYQTDTYFSGDSLSLPAEPVIEGKTFTGWFAGGTEYRGGEAVTSDLNINARFDDKFRVSFVVESEDGGTVNYAQYFRAAGDAVGSLPQDPFASGMDFAGWVDQSSGEPVTGETVVDGDITAVARFTGLGVYDITAEYYYINDSGSEVIFNTDLLQAKGGELPYTLTAPVTIQTESAQVKGAPIYYPETPEVTLHESDFTDNKATVRIKYVKYTATYDFVYLLKDLEGEGYTEIERTSGIQGVLNSYVTPSVKAYDYYTLEEAEGAQITKASGQELAVRYARKNVQLTFETNGGSYVSGVTAPYGSKVKLPAENPEREGYAFEGWYSDEALTQKVSGSVTLSGNTTLYAKWKGDKVNYTIVYMFEKYDDTGRSSSYVYDNSRTAEAAVGSTVQASSATALARNGWEKDTSKNAASSVVVAADGSSVLKVYYKLKEYTFNFNAGTYSSGRSTYNVTADLTGLGVSGTGTLNYTMKVKLGQDISAAWPANVTGSYQYQSMRSKITQAVDFDGWLNSERNTRYVTKRTSVTEDMLPSSGSSITYTAQWTGSAKEYTVNYWLQNADDDGYTKSEVYSQTYTSSGGNLSAKDISGYTYDHGNSGAQNTTVYNFYYNRNTYKIDYYYGSERLNSIEKVKFDATISGGRFNWTPSADQCGVDSDYTFAGWYDNSSCQGEPYSFDRMPASNIVLYAKWEAPSYTVSFVDGSDPSLSLAEAQTVEKYRKAAKPANPAKASYTFDGWYTAAEGGALFDWNTQITADTTVYAHWAKKNISYIVRYLDEEGNAVASDKEVTNPNLEAGQEISETAIAVAGYRPREVSRTLVLAEEDNLITFVYTSKAEKTSYTVRYLISRDDFDGNIPVAAEKKVEDVPGNTSSVVELAASVDYAALYAAHPELDGIEFHPDSASKTLVLTSDAEQNVLTFYYSSYKRADVTIHFVDMEGNKIAGDDLRRIKPGESFALPHTPIEGWELSKAVSGTSYDGEAAGTEYRISEKTAESGLEFTLFYQKKATITALSAGKQYDGEVLTLPEEQVRVEGLLDGHSLDSVSFTYENADADNGRIEAGAATVTPRDAVIRGPSAGNYYAIRYISGTLEVSKINVTIRVEPDRWTGARYTGEVYEAGFTNPGKGIDDYVIISHEGYKKAYLDTIWNALRSKTKYDASGKGLKYYGIAEKNAGNYTYDVELTMADLPKDDNYSVGLYVRPGRLQILPKDIVVSTQSDSKAYDGKALTNEGASIDGLAASDAGKVTVKGTGTQTEIGSSDNTYSVSWGDVNPGNYNIAGESLGMLTVTEAGDAVILTAASASKVYDGTALSDPEVTAAGLPDGFTAEATASGSQTDAGTSANVVDDGFVIRNAAGDNKTANFKNITRVDGKLTVSQAALTVTTGSGEKAYDGTALTAAEASIEGFVNDETAEVTATGSQTEPGSSDNTYTINWGDTKAGNYAVSAKLGTLTVTESNAEITLTAASGSKTYDGKELTADGVSAEGLPEGFTVEARVSGSRIDAGTSDNVIDSFAIRDSAGADRTAYFTNVKKKAGTLTVEPKEVTLTTGSASKGYDGSELTNREAKIEGLVNGESVTLAATGTITEIGSVANSCDITWESAKSANYTVTEQLGTLTVTANESEVTLTAPSAGRIYDGTALTADGSGNDKIVAGGLPEGFTVEARAEGSQTDAGESANIVADGYVIRNADGEDRTSNFTNVKKIDGVLKVEPRSVTIVTGSSGKPYDGEPLTNDVVNITGLVDGETVGIEATGTITEKGSKENTYSISWAGEGNDFTAKESNYAVTENLGTLTVTDSEAEVVLTAASDSKTYDGTALTNDEVTASGLPAGFTVEAKASGSQTDAGECANVVNDGYVIKNAAGEDKTANFTNVAKVDGKLTVNPKQVTITTGSADKAYDGRPLTQAAVRIDGIAAGETYGLEATGSVTEVGEADNTYSLAWASDDNSYTAKAGNYTISESLGKLIVTPNGAEIRFTAASGNKVYDGTALTAAEVTATGLPAGFTAEAAASGSRKDAGSSANAVSSYKIKNADGEDKTGCFTNVSTAEGILTVSQRPVKVKTGSDSKEYDGTALTNADASVEGLAEGERASVKATGSRTEVGSSANTYEIHWGGILGLGTKAENYAVTEELGTLTVSESSAEIVLTAPSDSKVYDGTPLTVDGTGENKVTASGLPEGFTVSATASGSRIDAGESANVVDDGYAIRNAAGEDVTASFANVKKAEGTLTVERRKISFASASAEKTYDGTALINSEVTVGGYGFAAGEGATFSVSGSQLRAGSSPNAFTYALTGGTNASNYDISTSFGQLTVTSRDVKYSITLTPNSFEGKYDGTLKTAEGLQSLSFTVDGNVYTVSGVRASRSERNAGTYPVSVAGTPTVLDSEGNDVSSEFEVTSLEGELRILPRTVTLTSADASKAYDGNELANGDVAVGGEGFAEGEGAAFDVTGRQLTVGVSPNTFTYTLNGGTEAGNYQISTTFGTLTVTNRDAKYEVSVQAAGGEFLYDGREHVVSGFAGRSGMADGDGSEGAGAADTNIITVSAGGNDYTVEGLTAGAAAEDVGEYVTSVSGEPVVRDAAGNDVSDQFAVTAKTGKLIIKPRQITMTSGSATHAYNGKVLRNEEVSVTGDGFADGEGASYDVTGGRALVGISENTFDYTLNEGTSAGNYEISKVCGKLEVTNRDAKYVLTMTPNSGSVLYDGAEHEVSGFASTTAVIDGESYEVSGLTAGASGVDAGTYEVSVRGTPVVTDAAGNDVSDQFSVVTGEAALTIMPRRVVLRSSDESREYNGTPLAGSGEISVEGDGFAEGEGVTVTPAASRTLVGAIQNSFDWEFNEGTSSGNYEIEVEYGLLSIISRDALYEIKMIANSDSVEYDGEEHSVSGFETYEFEVEGSGYTVSGVETGAAGIDPGVYTTDISGAAEVSDSDGNDVSDQFAVSYESGSLTIREKESGGDDQNGGGDDRNGGNTDDQNGGNGTDQNGGGGQNGGNTDDQNGGNTDDQNGTDQTGGNTDDQNGTDQTSGGGQNGGDDQNGGNTDDQNGTDQTGGGDQNGGGDQTGGNGGNGTDQTGGGGQNGGGDQNVADQNGGNGSNQNGTRNGGGGTANRSNNGIRSGNDASNAQNGNGDVELTNIPDTIPAAAAPSGYWALLNLIMAIITVLAAIYMIIRRSGKDEDDPDDDGSDRNAGSSVSASMAGSGEATGSDLGKDDEDRRRKRMPSVIASVLLAIISAVAFFLTEDMTNTMALTDRYTILMAVLLILSIASVIFGRKKTDDDEDRARSSVQPQ